MRVTMVTETYPPEVNGVALTVAALEDGLRARGHTVNVVRPRQGNADAATRDCRLVSSMRLPRYAGLRLGLCTPGALRKAWRRSRPDVVYVATEGPLGWSAVRAATQLDIPVATGFHTRFDHYMRAYGAPFLEATALRMLRGFHNRADATLVPTRELQVALQGLRFDSVVRLPRAVDTTLFHPARRDTGLRARWGAGDDTPVAMVVGRIAAEKHLDLAISAFRGLRARRPDARCVFVGDGPLREALQRANPDIFFCGMQRDAELARHFASGDVFAFPSLSETFGNVTLEAMASGLATVAFNYGAAREYLRDGVHGAAVPVGDDAAFEAAVLRIGSDSARCMAMGRAAHAATAALRPATVALHFEQILQDLVAVRHGDRLRLAA